MHGNLLASCALAFSPPSFPQPLSGRRFAISAVLGMMRVMIR